MLILVLLGLVQRAHGREVFQEHYQQVLEQLRQGHPLVHHQLGVLVFLEVENRMHFAGLRKFSLLKQRLEARQQEFETSGFARIIVKYVA